jgi:hypothetical protein
LIFQPSTKIEEQKNGSFDSSNLIGNDATTRP